VTGKQRKKKPLLFDASVLIAFLRREPGWEVVQKSLRDDACLVSVVQLIEAEGKLVGAGHFTSAAVRGHFVGLGQVIGVLPVAIHMQQAASFYYARRHAYDLSLGDCVCLGTAEAVDADILTAESNWKRLPDLPFDIKLIRA
jgi:ribonuclease VapC